MKPLATKPLAWLAPFGVARAKNVRAAVLFSRSGPKQRAASLAGTPHEALLPTTP